MYSSTLNSGQSPYDLLKVKKTATLNQIKTSFRNLAKIYHPDRDTGDEEKFKNITEAYEILSDPVRRQTYDRSGLNGLKAVAQEKSQQNRREGISELINGARKSESNAPSSINQSWKIDNNNQMFNDLFTHFFKKAAEQKAEQVGGDKSDWGTASSVYQTIALTLKEVYSGCIKTIKYHRDLICQSCYGKGYQPSCHPEYCKVCQGQGMIKNDLGISDCSRCQGRGKIYDPSDQCLVCEGKKFISKENKIEIEVQPGMNEKIKLKYESLGHEEPGKNPGDLVITFRITGQTFPYEVDEDNPNNLRLVQKISLIEALSGVRRDLPYIDGTLIRLVTEKDEVVQQDEVKVYPGSGLPIYDQNSTKQRYGDLLVEYHVVLPETLDSKTRDQICNLLRDNTKPIPHK